MTSQPPAPAAVPARPESRMRAAARALAEVLRNRDIRSLELSWTIGVGVDWAWSSRTTGAGPSRWVSSR
jgi:hypothetical protein